MARTIWMAAAAALLWFARVPHVAAQTRDTQADTWVASDALGRTLPLHEAVGKPKADKLVAMFYYMWHQRNGAVSQVYDTSKIIAGRTQPWSDAPWGPLHWWHWWGEPHLGYYDINDEFVLRKHTQMMADAGIDVVLFDVTNGGYDGQGRMNNTYDATVQKICKVYRDIRKQGGKTPLFAFLTNSNSGKVATYLYDQFYAKGTCSELWFKWQGKPLMLGKVEEVSGAAKTFFSFRYSWAWNPGAGNWPWLDYTPQRDGNGGEELSVATAQHPTSNYGKSYHAKKQPALNASYTTADTGRGLGFQEQWDQAIKASPKLVLVTQWNEWIAQRSEGDGNGQQFLGKRLNAGDSFFVDTFNSEFNRDIEPMRGGFGDNYYYQLIANVRRFKGARAAPPASAPKRIRVSKGFASWSDVRPEYLDDLGDITHRSALGFSGPAKYENDSGRNDLEAAKVTRDEDFLHFYIRTATTLSAHSDASWMWLFIDADANVKTGWNGFEFLVNRSRTGNEAKIERYAGSAFSWTEVEQATLAHAGDELALSVPRAAVGLPASKGALAFNFKWADALPATPNALHFIDRGDVAPNGRFAYQYRAATDINGPVSGDEDDAGAGNSGGDASATGGGSDGGISGSGDAGGKLSDGGQSPPGTGGGEGSSGTGTHGEGADNTDGMGSSRGSEDDATDKSGPITGGCSVRTGDARGARPLMLAIAGLLLFLRRRGG